MGLMPPRLLSLVLPALAALGIGGVSLGSALAALPPPPVTVSVPTVTVPLPPPPVPLPVPPPPTVTVPPRVEPPPVPPAPPAPIDPPAAVTPAVSPPSIPPGLRGSGASSTYYTSRRPSIRKQSREPARRSTAAPTAERRAAARPASAPRASTGVEGTTVAVQGPVPEDAGFFGPVAGALSNLGIPRDVIPPALFAMAALAILLLAMASAPLPARTSRTSATLVHMRGSIALAGLAALTMAVATYFLL